MASESPPLEDGTPPPSLTFVLRQAHSQNLPSGDGIFQKHIHGLRGDSGWGGRRGSLRRQVSGVWERARMEGSPGKSWRGS